MFTTFFRWNVCRNISSKISEFRTSWEKGRRCNCGVAGNCVQPPQLLLLQGQSASTALHKVSTFWGLVITFGGGVKYANKYWRVSDPSFGNARILKALITLTPHWGKPRLTILAFDQKFIATDTSSRKLRGVQGPLEQCVKKKTFKKDFYGFHPKWVSLT